VTRGEPELAVVTGGAGGIGAAVCRDLGTRGYHVVALGRDADALAELGAKAHADGRTLTGLRCDVTDEDAVARTVAVLPAGNVAVLVHAAGFSETATLPDTGTDLWERHLAVNATGAFLLTRALLPGMRERDRGRVVAIASTAALTGSRYTAAYSASKHALLGLVRAVAADVAGSGVTCNAICPTFVRSPMTDRSVRRIVERTGRDPAQATAALAYASPLGRLVEPEEVAAAVSYFASDAAGCVNAQTLVLDGGGIQS
jgi:NAD(P)-dependent dehydrogenase (short-subunit alcohol dehydrogenase family)